MKGIIAWFAHNHVAANLMMFGLIVAGLVTLPDIQQKSFPDIDVKVIQVTVPYLGAAPEEVESGVCVRIEEAIQGINGIEFLNSLAAEGACTVSAELITGFDEGRVQSEIKNAVDAIDTFPEETEKATVAQFVLRRMAIQIALSGDVEERALKVYGQRIRDELLSLPEITQVELSNARNYEIAIEVSESALRRHGLGFDQVVDAVRQSSLDLPGGAIKTERGEILLRSKGQSYTGAEFEEIVVLTRTDGTRLRLGDFATVRDGFEDDDRYARFNGERAVLIQVYRIGDQKVLDLVAEVSDYVESTRGWLPDAIHLTVWRDGSRSLRDRLDILDRNGRQGFLLVFCLLALFLRLRLAFWVSIGVPLSFLGAVALFPSLGISINVISLFAFILVLGLLVDDAIVVGESVHSHQERAEDPLASAITGTQEVSIPVIFGVLTTVAAFTPLITAPGVLGQIFSEIGVVVILCLIFSVVESQLILPTHLAHSRKEKPTGGEHPIQLRWRVIQTWFATALTRLAERNYRHALGRALEWRYSVLAAGIALLLCSMAIVASGAMKFTFFPPIESDYVSATLTMPRGIPVEATEDAVSQLEAAVGRVARSLDDRYGTERGPIIRHVLASVGEHPSARDQHGGGGSRPVSSSSHLGEVSIELQSADGRPISALDVAQAWREETGTISDAVELTYRASIFSAGDPIHFRLQSSNVDDLRTASAKLKARLAEYPGVIDIRDSYREGKEEIQLSILPSAESLGLSLEDLARQVRHAFYGAEAQRIQRGRDDVRVMVRYPESERRSLGDLDAMRIRTPEGAEVPFGLVAKAERGRGFASIWRTNRMRVIRVNADVDRSRANANEVMADLGVNFMPQLLAEHPGLSYRLHGEQREQAKVVGGLIRGFGIALVMIYALLAIPLRSYSQPLIIMAVIPFGLVGAILGHLLMGSGLSMMSVFGTVALAGVVVNASLVMVHYVNRRREEGDPLESAVRAAGVARFRPIVLTSLTTFAGLTPLLLEKSVSAQFLIPMAISLAFGVVFATVVTLFLVPSAYMILEDLRMALRRTPTPAVVESLEADAEIVQIDDKREASRSSSGPSL